jgi:hypothetical protein
MDGIVASGTIPGALQGLPVDMGMAGYCAGTGRDPVVTPP